MTAVVGAQIVASVLAEYRKVVDVVHIESPGEKTVSATNVKEYLRTYKPEILVVEATPVDSDLLSVDDNIKLIVCTRGNPVNIDLDACRERGIVVTNTPHRNANAVAEFTIALMVSLLRRIPEAYSRLRRGEFTAQHPYTVAREEKSDRSDVIWSEDGMKTIPYFEFQGLELAGKTLGVIGYGGIGRRVTEMARRFDMDVVVYDPFVADIHTNEVTAVSLADLLSRADIVSLHAKETAETIGMVNDEFLAAMKEGAYLVNTSRGRLVDRDALIRALERGKPAGAALDVFDYEPLSADDPLLSMGQVVCTPHIGGASKDVVFHQSRKTLESITAFVANEEIPYRVV